MTPSLPLHFLLKTTLLSCCLLIISACESINPYLPSWIGGSSEEKLKGERIAVLEEEKYLQADDNLADKRLILPAPQENLYWYKSQGFQTALPGHIQGPNQLTEHESIDTGWPGRYDKHLKFSPLITKNAIITLDGRGKLSAYDRNNPKKRLWRTPLEQNKHQSNFALSGIATDENLVFATSGGHRIYAVKTETGEIIWSKTVSGITRSAPALNKDFVYINTLNNKLYALSKKDGTIIWTHEGIIENIGTEGVASPLVDNGIVYASYSSGEIYALKADTGKSHWTDALLSGYSKGNFVLADLDASPAIKDGVIYASSNDGVLAAIDSQNGFRVWEQKVASRTTPWIAGDFLFIISTEEQLLCIERQTGRIYWERKLPAYINQTKKKGRIFWSAPILVGGNLLTVNSEGTLLLLSPENGRTKETHDIGEKVFSPIAIAGNVLYILDNDADLHIYKGIAYNPTSESTAHSSSDPLSETTEHTKTTEKGFFQRLGSSITGLF